MKTKASAVTARVASDFLMLILRDGGCKVLGCVEARHTAITAMLHAGASLESVMAIPGHSAHVMAMRYAHSTEATRCAAVSPLEQFATANVPLSLHDGAQHV